MCHFHYRKFDTCGHHSIEVSYICDQALWRAGLRGVLQVCVPRILERSLEWSGRDDHEPPKPALFRGYDGFCELCVVEFKLPCAILQRSYSDRELDYSRPWNTFCPDDLAPYLYFDGLFAKIPELLGLSDQFEFARIKQGPHITFHKSLERCTWSQLRKALPFTFPGKVQSDCTLEFDEVMERLKINLGITEYDKDQVIHAIQHGPHPRVVYNRLFRHRGMPLGHFNACIVNSCQQAVSPIREQEAVLLKESLNQPAEYSDDSALTTLTNTPVLSDVELFAPKTPSRETEASDTPKDDGPSSTPRGPRTPAARLADQAATGKRTLATISPSQDIKKSLKLSTSGGASVLQEVARETSPYQLGKIKVEAAHGNAGWDGGIDSKASAHGAKYEHRSTAGDVNRPRRLAIAQQSVDEWRLRPLDQGSNGSNTKTSAFDKSGQEPGFLNRDPQQPLKSSSRKSGNGAPAAVPYYQPGRVFEWKILESPGHRRTQEIPGPSGSRERTTRGQQGGLPVQTPGAEQSQTALQPPAQPHPTRAPSSPARNEEDVFVSIDPDGDVKMEGSAQSPPKPETRLDPTKVRRLQELGVWVKSLHG